jgi:tRNA G10  N-methylase Trm11
LEFYNSDVDFRRGIWKLLALYTKIKESNIREICHNESASSRINNFPPRAAISILKHLYTGQRIIVLDPCAGFSGRLIGSFCSGVVDKYIGIDLSEKISTGLLKTKEVLRTINDNFKIDIIQDDCLNAMNNFEGNIDCVFTSPPFLDEEEYVGVQIEKDYEKWKQNFVKPFILDAYRVLKNEGRLVVYIESIRKHNFPMDFCDIADDIGFKKEKNILFRVAYGENLRDKSISRSVKIIVFQKG